jgi:hypothetical protein
MFISKKKNFKEKKNARLPHVYRTWPHVRLCGGFTARAVVPCGITVGYSEGESGRVSSTKSLSSLKGVGDCLTSILSQNTIGRHVEKTKTKTRDRVYRDVISRDTRHDRGILRRSFLTR